jgi:predicted ester cyclase
MTNNTIRSSLAAAGIAIAAVAMPVQAQQALTHAQARKLVEPFYSMLNQPSTKDLKALAEQSLSPDWKSYAGENDFKGREAFVGMAGGFGKLIPDLKWDIKEVLVDGDRIVVRSEGSGTPVGPLFGIPASGKSFKVMAIDIHTFKNGKGVLAYHIEDWATAMQQLSAK